jgi:hypothetical protein
MKAHLSVMRASDDGKKKNPAGSSLFFSQVSSFLSFYKAGMNSIFVIVFFLGAFSFWW